MARSLRKGDEPWMTFTVQVRVVRNQPEVYAKVGTSYVTGIVGPTGARLRPLWEGVIAMRDCDVRVTPEQAALWSQDALEKAFPTLW